MKLTVAEWDARSGVQVEIMGMGSVKITAEWHEGIVAEIVTVNGEPVATTSATHDELDSEDI